MTPIQRTISSVRPVLSLSAISLPSIPQPRYNHRREATERSLETATVVEAQRVPRMGACQRLRHAVRTVCRATAHAAAATRPRRRAMLRALAYTEASGQEASHIAELLPDLPDTPRPLARRTWPRAAAGYASAVPLGREAAASDSETFSFIEVC